MEKLNYWLIEEKKRAENNKTEKDSLEQGVVDGMFSLLWWLEFLILIIYEWIRQF